MVQGRFEVQDFDPSDKDDCKVSKSPFEKNLTDPLVNSPEDGLNVIYNMITRKLGENKSY